jgi:hypothetical protein
MSYAQHADNIFHGIANMNTNFKNGDVIVIRNPRGVEMIAIFDKFGADNTLHIYVEFDTSEVELYFKCADYDFCYDLNKIEYRLATDADKEVLYYHLFIHFTVDWDLTWMNHFTDSSYFDILDCLLDAFSIKVSEEDGWDYPEFVQEIRNYIWDECCHALQILSDIPNTDRPDKMVSLDDVISWLLENAGEYSVEVADAIENDIIPRLRREI